MPSESSKRVVHASQINFRVSIYEVKKQNSSIERGERCAIAIMAKAPRAGFSKTRLCPPLAPEQAATLSAAFLNDTSESLAAAATRAPITPYAAYAPLGTEALLARHLAPQTKLLLADGSIAVPPGVEGFGRCLLHAIAAQFEQGHAAAAVLSSDTPNLPAAYLVQASDLLLAGGPDRIVFGACDDGGYYFLGMNRLHDGLFRDIAWSTETVAETTRLRAAEQGLEIIELPVWYDIDDAESLARLDRETEGDAAPATRRALAALSVAAILAGQPAA